MADTAIHETDWDILFRNARTFKKWQPRPVEEGVLRRLWELASLGPTSFNSSPLRARFLVSKDAKARLMPHLMEPNRPQVEAAPVAAIFAYDKEFHGQFSLLSPHFDPSGFFAGEDNRAFRESTAFRNGSLQAAYFMVAARGLGLDCGPMSGFDNAGVDREFFAGTTLASNLICNLGYGDPDGLHPRAPRLSFEQGAELL